MNDEMNDERWLNVYMGTNNYSIIDNEGDGDCLFYALINAFESINQKKTVKTMRKLISDNANDSVYNNYKSLYISFVESIKENNDKMKAIQIMNEEMKIMITKTECVKEKRKIMNDGKKITENFNEYKNQNNNSLNMLTEYDFMSNINSLDEFKQIILDSRFWADTWAITTLEREMNLKIVILSSENFGIGDIDNVLLCGQHNDNNEEKSFNPDYYIIVDYNGCHYKLISYDDMLIFDYETLPIEIKELIKTKCLEKMGGTYDLIREFRVDTKNNLKQSENVNKLYDDEERTDFMIHSKSSNKPNPGCGSGEKNKDRKYSKL